MPAPNTSAACCHCPTRPQVNLAAFSLLVSNLGLTNLIAFSIPVLTAIYPPCIVLVALSFCKDFWLEQGRIVGPVMLVSFLFGLIDALKGAGLAGLDADATDPPAIGRARPVHGLCRASLPWSSR